jgi:Sec7-like guanine-nucleotide exchange factor
LSFWRNVIVDDLKQRSAASVPSTKESLETAIVIAQQKSLKKAVEYLIACNTLTPAPRDIATFLCIHKDRLDSTALGNYLSESGTSGAEMEYWNSVRHLFVRAISFIGMNIEEG